MSETFTDQLRVAAKLSFQQEISNTTDEFASSGMEVDLDGKQIQTLSDKMLLLPTEAIFVLFSKYCFHLTPTETELFYQIQHPKALLRYYKHLLSYDAGEKEFKRISDSSFRDACNIALHKYLAQELSADQYQPILFMPKTRSTFRKIAQKVAIAAIIAMMSFSTMMVANAEFRQRVVSWVIETFEKYSIFELKSDDMPTIQELENYKPSYIPDEFHLLHTVEQPSLIWYQYGDTSYHTLHIFMSLSDTRIYVDTEGVELEQLDLANDTAYYFEKEAVHHIIFQRNGYYFAVYGTISKDEVMKVAEGIQPQ